MTKLHAPIVIHNMRDFAMLIPSEMRYCKKFLLWQHVVVPLSDSRKHFHDRPFPRSRRVTTSVILVDRNGFFIICLSPSIPSPSLGRVQRYWLPSNRLTVKKNLPSSNYLIGYLPIITEFLWWSIFIIQVSTIFNFITC